MGGGGTIQACLFIFCLLASTPALSQQIIEFPLEVELVGQRSEITGYVSEDNIGYWAINGQELFELLHNYLTAERLSQLESLFLKNRIDETFLAQLGWKSEYDDAELVVKIAIPLQDRRVVDLNFTNRNQASLSENYPKAEPAMFSGVINAYLSHTRNLYYTELYGNILSLRTGMALGSLTFEDGHSYYQNSNDQDLGWQREHSRLMYDIPNNYGFLQLGDYYTETDIQPLNPGEIFGLSYSYQPEYLDNYTRPNMVPLTLESNALVTIRINGEEYKTLRLPPGQYNLNDLPLDNGVNDVEISYRDQAGNEVIRYYSLIDSPSLLLKSDWETQWTAGFWQEYNELGIKEFDNDRPAAKAVIAYGLTSWWTLSALTEWEEKQKDYGLLHNFAVGNNFLTLDTRFQESNDMLTGQYNISFYMPTLAWDTLKNANFSYSFTQQDPDSAAEDLTRLNFSTSINTSMKNGYVSLNLGSGFENGDNIENTASVNTYYRFWDYLSLGLNLRLQHTPDNTESHVNLSLSIPLGFGGNITAHSRYDSSREQIESEISVSNYAPKQSWRGSLNFIDDDYESADIYYRRNSDIINGNISLSSKRESSDSPTRSGSIGLESGIAWAGSSFALTAPLGSSFTIVSLSEEFEDYALKQGDYGRLKIIPAEEGGARTAVLRVANRGHRRIKINSEELDFDKELEFNEFIAIGGLRRGSAFELNLLNGYFITGMLVDSTNAALVDMVGELTAQDDGKTYPFYTDELGGFELDMVPAGDYKLRLYDGSYASVVVTIDGEHAENDVFIDINTIKLGRND
ncbi:MAG: hypothetical protein HRT97_03500 [Moritella sp.]|uniref:hypothetical protein n=1 Tax=Moritella sp. TaxID=78556 RepID=UPI0025D1825A|nr:hypothetical protein [Moritella sp.]NQZ91392.1 hypothetical protein [Moritella sp.]